MRNVFGVFGMSSSSYASPPAKGDPRRASYAAVPTAVTDRGRRTSGGASRRHSYGANRRKSLDPAAVLGRHVFDGRLVDPRTRRTCKCENIIIDFYHTRIYIYYI